MKELEKQKNDRPKFKRLNFDLNEVIINTIVDQCVFDGRINHMLIERAKQVFLIMNYPKYIEEIKTNDGTTDIIAMFDVIREQELYTKFKKEYHRDDIEDFDRLLLLELQEESKVQLHEKSIEKVVEDFLWILQSKIPDKDEMLKMMKDLPKLMNGLDKGKIENIMNLFEKIDKK